jgi:predicted thioesterase
MDKIRKGLVGEETTTVVDSLLATALGSGTLDVYATPAMIALIEGAAVAAIDPLLPPEKASVGIGLAIDHLAATPPGHLVRARAEVVEVDGRKVTFEVEAWDEAEQIGSGTHTRYIIDVTRFVERVNDKRK